MGTRRGRHSIVNRRNDQRPAASARQLAELVDRHGPALVLYTRQICDEPEDVVQEAFLEFMEQSTRPDNVAAWLFLFWSSDDRQIADEGDARDNSVLPETDSPVRNANSQTRQTTGNSEFAIPNNLPSRRSELLGIRRVTLARGVAAAFSADADDAAPTGVGRPTRQELLRELLGS